MFIEIDQLFKLISTTLRGLISTAREGFFGLPKKMLDINIS